jgi:hypothetical protein
MLPRRLPSTLFTRLPRAKTFSKIRTGPVRWPPKACARTLKVCSNVNRGFYKSHTELDV